MLTHFVERFTEIGCIVEILKASHGVIALFNRPVVPLNHIIFILAGSMFDFLAQHFSNGFRVRIMLISGYPWLYNKKNTRLVER